MLKLGVKENLATAGGNLLQTVDPFKEQNRHTGETKIPFFLLLLIVFVYWGDLNDLIK